jgi:hypothetical protein
MEWGGRRPMPNSQMAWRPGPAWGPGRPLNPDLLLLSPIAWLRTTAPHLLNGDTVTISFLGH